MYSRFVVSRLSAPGPQERRFAAYIEGPANAAGHEDRHATLMNYCNGWLLPGERKSIEPIRMFFYKPVVF
jgi:SRSO17 transposase